MRLEKERRSKNEHDLQVLDREFKKIHDEIEDKIEQRMEAHDEQEYEIQ